MKLLDRHKMVAGASAFAKNVVINLLVNWDFGWPSHIIPVRVELVSLPLVLNCMSSCSVYYFAAVLFILPRGCLRFSLESTLLSIKLHFTSVVRDIAPGSYICTM